MHHRPARQEGPCPGFQRIPAVVVVVTVSVVVVVVVAGGRGWWVIRDQWVIRDWGFYGKEI